MLHPALVLCVAVWTRRVGAHGLHHLLPRDRRRGGSFTLHDWPCNEPVNGPSLLDMTPYCRASVGDKPRRALGAELVLLLSFRARPAHLGPGHPAPFRLDPPRRDPRGDPRRQATHH